MLKPKQMVSKRKVQFLLGSSVFFTALCLLFQQNSIGKIRGRRSYDFNENNMDKNFLRPRFRFLKEPTDYLTQRCENNSCNNLSHVTWTIVNFIKSKSDHFLHRAQVRSMWQKSQFYKDAQFKSIFVVAKTNSETDAILLDEEHRKYNDILQMDGPDEYRFVPLKTLAGMQWASENLPRTFYYSSGDDDFLVDVQKFYNIVQRSRDSQFKQLWPTFPIICTYRQVFYSSPVRNATGIFKKWFIKPNEYKWPFYPRFCLGGFYTTSVDVISQLYDLSRVEPYLRVDDVWITGILRQKIGMPNEMLIATPDKIAEHLVGKTPDEFLIEKQAQEENKFNQEHFFEVKQIGRATGVGILGVAIIKRGPERVEQIK